MKSKNLIWIVIVIAAGLALTSVYTSGILNSNSPAGAFVPPSGEGNAKGDPNAPVTMIEYSDFQCPFCGRYFRDTFPSIEEEYISTGKVYYIFRHFPLGGHAQAMPAARAAECAGEQGKFWEMHDLMFENQGLLSEGSYSQWAAQIGLDLEQFNECYASGKYDSKINSEYQEGQNAGVRGTPAFFVNGEAVSGAQPYSVFKAAIEKALS